MQRWRWWLWVFSLAGVALGADSPGHSRLDVLHPRRLLGYREAQTATSELDSGQPEAAERRFLLAVQHDPLLAGAWINLAAAEIQNCRREAAHFSATVGFLLTPEDPAAAHNRDLAAKLSCPSPAGAPTEENQAREAAVQHPEDAAVWLRLAQLARARTDRLTAVLFEEWALARGSDRGSGLLRIAQDLEQEGLLRAARAAWEELGGERAAQKIAELSSRLARVEPAARRCASRLAGPLAGPQQLGREEWVHLGEWLLVEGRTEEQACVELAGLAGRTLPARVQGEWGSVELEPGWRDMEIPSTSNGVRLLLRRFPFDTQLALFLWDGPGEESLWDSQLKARFKNHTPLALGPIEPCAFEKAPPGCRTAVLNLRLGKNSLVKTQAYWFGPPNGPPRYFVVALGGSGGCGAGCLREAEKAAERQLGRFLWNGAGGAAAASDAWSIPIPQEWLPVREHRERDEVWRGMLLADGWKVDVPPGVIGVKPAGGEGLSLPGIETCLLLRGEFEDLDGVAVTIGNDVFWGSLVRMEGRAGILAEARRSPGLFVPPEDPEARWETQAELKPALSASQNPGDGLALKFRGKEADAVWLVFLLTKDNDLWQLALPVFRGPASPSLAFLALTLRPAGSDSPPSGAGGAAAEPVRFLKGSLVPGGLDPREGRLLAAELQLAVPKGYRVSTDPRSLDGFPVSLRGEDGTLFQVERLAGEGTFSPEALQAAADEEAGLPRTEPWKKLSGFAAFKLWEGRFKDLSVAGKERVFWLLLPEKAGAGAGFRLKATRGEKALQSSWEHCLRLVRESLRYKAR